MQALETLQGLHSEQLAASGLLHLAVLLYAQALQAAETQGVDASTLLSAAQLIQSCSAASSAPLQQLLDATAERALPARHVLALSPAQLRTAHAAVAGLAAGALGQPQGPQIYPGQAGPSAHGELAFCSTSLDEVSPILASGACSHTC